MAKEFFGHRETETLFKQLEGLRHASNMSRGQAFEDWLLAMTCALAGETMEDQYMQMIERHKDGPVGKRGADMMAKMTGQLIHDMSETDADLLGDLFQGSISYGENGLYLTPESVTTMMAELTAGGGEKDPSEPFSVCDPCCGTGRMLLEAGKHHPKAELIGVDIDSRRM